VQNDDVRIIGPDVFHYHLLAAQQNYERPDTAACLKFNRDFLLWLGRLHLHGWYTLQQPRAGDDAVHHQDLVEESVFVPMVPFRTCHQMFGINHGAITMVAAMMVMDADFDVANGIDP
jgi:hypothetical protein